MGRAIDVVAKATRRQFTLGYKRRIVREFLRAVGKILYQHSGQQNRPDPPFLTVHKNESISAMNQPIIDYHRCPENLSAFQLAGSLSEDSRYFYVGPQTVCYGNSSSGYSSQQVTAQLYTVLTDVSADGGPLRLP